MNLGRTLALVLCASALAFAAPPPPEQPIPFDHTVHAGALKLKCNFCHPNPDPGDRMTIAAGDKCMQCHSAIKTDSPAIQRLAAATKNQREIKWVRVYELPGFVEFSHRTHITAGATCQDCHGQVTTQPQIFKAAEISMGVCMDCHRMKKVSIDCTFCHDRQ